MTFAMFSFSTRNCASESALWPTARRNPWLPIVRLLSKAAACLRSHSHSLQLFHHVLYGIFFSSHFALKWHVHGIIAILKEELVATNPAAASGATERLIKHTTLVLVGRTSVSVGDEAACLGLARTPVLISASIAWFVPEKLSSWSCVP